MMIKNMKITKSNINIATNLIEYNCLCCHKNYQQRFDEKLKERFFNTYKFSNHDKNSFILMLRKSAYLYECMDEYFYSHLDTEYISDKDCTHSKIICTDFEIQNSGEYHDLNVQRDTLLLVDVFEKFQNMCLKIYDFKCTRFLTSVRLAKQAALRKTKVKLGLLTDNDMLKMVEKGIRGGICHSIYRYANVNKKSMKDYDKHEESSYLQY